MNSKIEVPLGFNCLNTMIYSGYFSIVSFLLSDDEFVGRGLKSISNNSSLVFLNLSGLVIALKT